MSLKIDYKGTILENHQLSLDPKAIQSLPQMIQDARHLLKSGLSRIILEYETFQYVIVATETSISITRV